MFVNCTSDTSTGSMDKTNGKIQFILYYNILQWTLSVATYCCLLNKLCFGLLTNSFIGCLPLSNTMPRLDFASWWHRVTLLMPCAIETCSAERRSRCIFVRAQVTNFVFADYSQIGFGMSVFIGDRVILTTTTGDYVLTIARVPERSKVEHLIMIGNPAVDTRFVVFGKL